MITRNLNTATFRDVRKKGQQNLYDIISKRIRKNKGNLIQISKEKLTKTLLRLVFVIAWTLWDKEDINYN
jgi:hypothetical protein